MKFFHLSDLHIGLKLIERELARIPNEKVRQITADHIHDIAEGQRDFRF